MNTKPIILERNEQIHYKDETSVFALVANEASYERITKIRTETNTRILSIWTTLEKAKKAMNQFKNAEETLRDEKGIKLRISQKTELNVIQVEINTDDSHEPPQVVLVCI